MLDQEFGVWHKLIVFRIGTAFRIDQNPVTGLLIIRQNTVILPMPVTEHQVIILSEKSLKAGGMPEHLLKLFARQRDPFLHHAVVNLQWTGIRIHNSRQHHLFRIWLKLFVKLPERPCTAILQRIPDGTPVMSIQQPERIIQQSQIICFSDDLQHSMSDLVIGKQPHPTVCVLIVRELYFSGFCRDSNLPQRIPKLDAMCRQLNKCFAFFGFN